MGVATFDYAAWVDMYPEFASVTEAVATMQWGVATLFLDNTDLSLVQDVTQRATLLNIITAHLVKLFVPVAGVAPGGLVGRISNATEGSVSVTADYARANTNLEAWWIQTPYGAQYWALMAPFRTMRYIPGPTRYLGSAPYGLPQRWPR